MEREVSIAGRRWKISGDDSYASNLGEAFEPHLVALIAWLCDEGSHALDVGANIGCTALALSQIVGDAGKVAAVEPVPRTFAHLSRNLRDVPNVTLHNFAFGKTPGTVPMQGSDDNLSGAFIADQFTIGQ
ncbi:MAG TPA: FkbM family methyltransferase, partial [Paraburkholderia sp.]